MIFEVAYFIDALLAMCLPYVQSNYKRNMYLCLCHYLWYYYDFNQCIIVIRICFFFFFCLELSTHMEDFPSLEEDGQCWGFSEVSILHNDVFDVFPASSACMACCNTRCFTFCINYTLKK